ncbi:NTP transferase domain-containing protein [Paenochrobactrum pullorum]|uniref:NTP transferase domain-containing protein n=1 Tax=Paenochrobactrum pullorum TaxID=1324351 RepID=UPI0035BC58F2
MQFGRLSLKDALGAILAHTIIADEKVIKKGSILTRSDIEHIRLAGHADVLAAKLEALDIGEDDAARRIADCLSFENIRAGLATTGRVNFYAEKAGLFCVSEELVHAINRVDSSITLATLAPFTRTTVDMLVATVKIIPFAVDQLHMQKVQSLAIRQRAFAVKPFSPKKVGLIQTTLPNLKISILDKTAKVTARRLELNGSDLVSEMRVEHQVPFVAEAIKGTLKNADMAVIFGASAVCDPDDIVPQAIRLAGGKIERIGMPVDPGNLLILASLDGKPVLGAPGCSRSPKENGFDWILDRLMADLKVDHQMVSRMGVGGILSEIPSRPSPREMLKADFKGDVAIAVLAAGRSSRMGMRNKLLAHFDGVPLIRRSAEAAIAGGGRPVIVVLGHMAEEIDMALHHLTIKTIINSDYSQGLSTSIKAALDHLPPSATGLMIQLGDMPQIKATHIREILAAFDKSRHRAVVRATCNGEAGNPVVIPSSLFAELAQLQGDRGARTLIEKSAVEVIDVEIGEAALSDVDTAEALAKAGGYWADRLISTI